MATTNSQGKYYLHPQPSLSAITYKKHFQPNSRPQMVQKNAIAIRKSQGVSNIWWTTKIYPQPRTLQPYSTCHSKPFRLSMYAP